MVGDAVDALTEGSAGAAQAFTEQVAVLLQLLEAGAYRFPTVGPRRTRSAIVTRQPLRCVLMYPKIPFAL
ncbi:hypothetical protein [Streptomyces tendae]|uniref:hypothetical protein n=1 Tax=Streptomyces tendae TaxID=1932 RepID=UPI00365F540D